LGSANLIKISVWVDFSGCLLTPLHRQRELIRWPQAKREFSLVHRAEAHPSSFPIFGFPAKVPGIRWEMTSARSLQSLPRSAAIRKANPSIGKERRRQPSSTSSRGS